MRRGLVWGGIVGLILVAAGLAAFGIVRLGVGDEKEFSFPDSLGTEWRSGEVRERLSGQVTIPGQKNLIAKEDGSVIEANFCNPEENAGQYLMMFAVLEADKDRTLYISEPIEAGECAENIKIVGSNQADEVRVLVQPYQIGDGTKTNGASFNVLLLGAR